MRIEELFNYFSNSQTITIQRGTNILADGTISVIKCNIFYNEIKRMNVKSMTIITNVLVIKVDQPHEEYYD